MARLGLIASTVLVLMAGCATGQVFHTIDACPGVLLCDQLDEAFNVSGVYVTDSISMHCDMESGRWTEVFRRGQDATGTPLPESDHKSFAPGDDPAAMTDGFGDSATGEFYIGNNNLSHTLSMFAPAVQLRVSLLGQDDARYFSVFDGFSAHSDPLQLALSGLQYRMGTAGDGDLSALDGAVYDDTCTPAVWFGSGSCDAATDGGPALTLPLTATNQRNGRTPWPTLPVELKAISLHLHTQPVQETCLGMEQHFAFDGDVLNSIEDSMPYFVNKGDSFTISCKNSSWILPTASNSISSIPSSVNFTCATNTIDPGVGSHRMDNHPVLQGRPCMGPCPAGYSLYIPAADSRGLASAPDRATCLSPQSAEPARSLMDAAAQCGQRGEQLLDFVPDQRFITDIDTSQPLWLWMRRKSGAVVTQVNSRDEDSGSISAAQQECVQVNYGASPPALVVAECHSDTLGTNPYRNFVCMTEVGCGPFGVFHAGFCYSYLPGALPGDHVDECQMKGATPADYTASFVAEALPRLGVPTSGSATPLVGIYRRYGKFWRPDGSVVPVTEFEGDTYGDDTLLCAAIVSTDHTKLKAVECLANTENRGVICQTPGYTTLARRFCSVRYDQLLNSSSVGPAPTVTRGTTTASTATVNDEVIFTCPDGYNIHNLTEFHSATLTCRGFQEGWEYPATMPAELHGQPVECVFACDVSGSASPRNSELVTIGSDAVFRCVGPMQTSDGSSEQLATCDHTTGQVSAGALPCDHCLGSPFIPGENDTMDSSWDGTSRLESTIVTYTCHSGLQTPSGLTEQNQTCTANGWEGELEACSQCVPLEDELQTALSSLSGPQPFGSLATAACPSGLESGDGSLNASVSCLPLGWDWCLNDFNCSYCSGNPPNATAMATIDSDWDGQLRELDTTILYSCASGLETADGVTEQTVNCTGSGWQGDIKPCDVCSNPPNGSHPTIRSTQETGNGTLGSSLEFFCNSGLSLADGMTSILSVCSETGWSNCSQEIRCEYCTPLPHLPDGTMDWGDYSGETALGTEVTLTCNSGLALAGSLERTQTVVCDLNGWNHTDVMSCTVCDQNPPAPTSSMTLAWMLGDSQAVYGCPNNTMLPWGEVTYMMQCSPDGWSDCVPECTACIFPPAAGPGAVMVSYNVTRDSVTRYECQPRMASAGPTELEITCTETGWTEAEMISCEMCAGDPADAGPAQNRTGNVTGLIGNVLSYECIDSMATADGLTEQSMTCSEQGWTQAPAPCDQCFLPPAPDNVTQTWDLSENVTDAWVPVGSNITYLCSNVTATLTNSSSQTLVCGAEGWDGQPEPCVSCLGEIPDPGNGTEARNVSWDGSRQEGAVVRYTCKNGVQHEIRCIERQWAPAELGSCVVPTTTPSNEITMATKATYDDKYPMTTNYYWANIDVNMTSTHGDDTFSIGQGPAGFENSVVLQEGCMAHQKWASSRDGCAQNPANCENGFSFSMWARIHMESIETLFNNTASTHKRYLLSTGGDSDGSPGVAIYVEGHELHALVSTGAQYWDVSVVGQIISEQWINIGVRWSNTVKFDLPGTSTLLPGLQLYINSMPLARVAEPSAASGSPKEPLSPGEVMVGCHRTTANSAYRDFGAGEYDELAMWTRLLPSNESIFFLGGYDEQDERTSVVSLLQDLKSCPKCRTDAKMFRAAIDRVQKAIKTPAPTSAPVGSTAEATAGTGGESGGEEESGEGLPEGVPVVSAGEVSKVRALVDLVKVMTTDAKESVTPNELELFLSLHSVVGTSLNQETLAQWRNIEYTFKEEGGTAAIVNRFEEWAGEVGVNTEMDNQGDNIIIDRTADNTEMTLQRTEVFQLRQKPVVSYPIGKQGLNKVTFASDLFHKPEESACRFVDVSILFVHYSTLGLVSPQRYSTLDLPGAQISDLELEGHVVSIKYTLKSDIPGLAANCTPSPERLRAYPIEAALAHTNHAKAKRGILFHEDEINTGILRRACVWWNPELSDYGGWDTDGCKAVDSSDYHTKCRCAHFGQIGIMVQKDPPRVVDLEFMWLKVMKYILYTISALVLIVFIVVVIKIKALHEMFHLMRLNTAVGLLFGSVLMVLTDIPEIRADRHQCTGFAAAIHFFYLLAAAMVMLEGIADFISVTSGAIGGKLKAYVALAWGVPLLSLGYAMLMHLPDYGTDPRCMLGWPDEVKWTMFLPMVALLTFTFLMTSLVSCNMQASRLRKENIVAEQLTVCKGFVFFSFYFVCTWIVGLIAYLRLGLSIPSFYPLFQILNSTGGIVFFLFCGIGSERFRLLITGNSALRKKMLFSYTVTEQLSESQQIMVEDVPSRPATPEDEEEFDPDATGPRGPIVA